MTAARKRLRALHPARRSGANAESGAILVEFAMMLPFLVFLVFAIVDVGRAINYWTDETHLASQGARLAAVDRYPGGGSLAEYIKSQADTPELRDGGTSTVPAPGATVCISFPDGTSNVGDPVQVKVSTTYNWLPIIGDAVGAASATINGTATMRLERPPKSYSAGCTS